LVVGCRDSSEPEPSLILSAELKTPVNVNIKPAVNPEKNVTPIGIDIIMDTTDSMAGFAQSPAIEGKTIFVRTMELLLRAASGYTKNASVRYFRTDARVIEISEREFLDYDAPIFYKPMRWYAARGREEAGISSAEMYGGANIAEAIRFDSSSRLKAIITDLFENQSTNNELIKLIKTEYLNQGKTIAVIPVLSEFDGYVYDVFDNYTTGGKFYHGVANETATHFEPPTIADISKWTSAFKSTSGARVDMNSINQTKISGAKPKYRPFYIILIGEDGEAQDFLTNLTNFIASAPGDPPIYVGEPPLAFTEYKMPQLIGTTGAGEALSFIAGEIEQLPVQYYKYIDINVNDEGKLLSSLEKPTNTALYRYMWPMNEGQKINVSVPASLIASAEDAANPILRELYDNYKIVCKVSVIPISNSNGVTLEINGEKRRRESLEPKPEEEDKGYLKCVSATGGRFTQDLVNPLRADTHVNIEIDPAALPEELRACRVQVDIYIRRDGSAVVRTPTVDKYPWATDWTLNLRGQTEQAWIASPSLRQLDKTINLDSFVGMLLNSKAEVQQVPDSFPELWHINSFVIDLFIIR